MKKQLKWALVIFISVALGLWLIGPNHGAKPQTMGNFIQSESEVDPIELSYDGVHGAVDQIGSEQGVKRGSAKKAVVRITDDMLRRFKAIEADLMKLDQRRGELLEDLKNGDISDQEAKEENSRLARLRLKGMAQIEKEILDKAAR